MTDFPPLSSLSPYPLSPLLYAYPSISYCILWLPCYPTSSPPRYKWLSSRELTMCMQWRYSTSLKCSPGNMWVLDLQNNTAGSWACDNLGNELDTIYTPLWCRVDTVTPPLLLLGNRYHLEHTPQVFGQMHALFGCDWPANDVMTWYDFSNAGACVGWGEGFYCLLGGLVWGLCSIHRQCVWSAGPVHSTQCVSAVEFV